MGKLQTNLRLQFFGLAIAAALLTACSDEVRFSQANITSEKALVDPDQPGDPGEPANPDQPDPQEPDPQEPDPQEPDPQEPDPQEPDPREPKLGEETFSQTGSGGKLDLLFIVDNSDSMVTDHYNRRVYNMFAGFMDTLQGVDLHLGVTTTSVNKTSTGSEPPQPGWEGSLDNIEGTRAKYLTSASLNSDLLLRRTLDREESIPCRRGELPEGKKFCGSNWEQPLKALQLMVARGNQSANKGFLRPDADLTVVIISDQDETARNVEDTTEAEAAKQFVMSALGPSKNLTVHGVIIEPGDKSCLSEQRWEGDIPFIAEGATEGQKISKMASITGGITTSICKSNVVSDLSIIGKNVRSEALFTKVTLEHQPLSGSVRVAMNPESSIGFRVEGKNVVFDQAPAPNTEVKITYAY